MSNKDGNHRRPLLTARLAISAAGLMLLLGCNDTAGGAGQYAESPREGSAVPLKGKVDARASGALDSILDKAIQVGEGKYMLPKGIDEDGCEMFGAYSTSGPSVTAIQYRQADGGFDIAKDPAVCRVDMVAIGTDPSGCEMYRAKPINADLSTTDVTYFRDADGRYVVHQTGRSCDQG
ncbi:MAG: hypothetical protein ACRBM6_30765 [Geminicoccales bacterium]